MASKSGKMQQWLNYRIRITIQDNREMIGQFLAFDKYMNLVLADAEEFRRASGKNKTKSKKDEKIFKRPLGLVIVRGETIVSMSIEGPPPPEETRSRLAPTTAAGPGVGRAAGRALAIPPTVGRATNLAGPPKGLGGPHPGMMVPRGPPQFQGPPGPGFRGGPGGSNLSQSSGGGPPGGPGTRGPPPGVSSSSGPPPPGGSASTPPGFRGSSPGFRGGPPPGFRGSGAPPPGGFRGPGPVPTGPAATTGTSSAPAPSGGGVPPPGNSTPSSAPPPGFRPPPGINPPAGRGAGQ